MVQMLPDAPIKPDTHLAQIVGVIGAGVVLLMAPLPFRIKLALLRAVRQHCPAEPTVETVERVRGAILWAARLWPGKFVCRHLAISTYLVCALSGTAPTLCLGARFYPARQHVWLEVHGQRVGETTNPWPYQALLKI